MDDPRDVLDKNFGGYSSDEDREEVDILEQLGKLEYEKQKLLKQLKERASEQESATVQDTPKTQSAKPVNTNKQSTSYFVDNYEKSKQLEKIEKQHQQEFMKRRIHTFRDMAVEYKPRNVNEMDPYSKKWLSLRYLPETALADLFQDKKILRLPKLFAKVRPPDFHEPDYSNWVCCGILTKKTDIKVTSNVNKASKYFSMVLTDFTFEIKLLIFGDKNVKKYYNLNCGDVIGVLNPSIWPWNEERGKAKSFNLCLKNDGCNSIIEIGKSRDFGFCPIRNYMTKERCNTPINLELEDRCTYHQERQINKGNSQRVELNGKSTTLRGPRDRELIRLSNGKYTTAKVDLKQPDKYSLLKKKSSFSTVNAAKAFYDDEYVNPDMLNNLPNKRRRIKDYNNELKLKERFGLTNNGLEAGTKRVVKPLNETVNEKLKDFIAPSLLNDAQARKSEAIESLMNVQKAQREISLKPSRKDIEERIAEKKTIWNKYHGKPSLQHDIFDDDDDDDDLFIVR